MRPGGSLRKLIPELVHHQQWKCFYCMCEFQSLTFVTVDHLWPTSKGGRNGRTNIVAACDWCNNVKADRLPTKDELLRAIKYTEKIRSSEQRKNARIDYFETLLERIDDSTD